MGITAATASFLIHARESGASFTNTLTIGRLFISEIPTINRLLRKKAASSRVQDIPLETRYADPFLRWLGCDELHCLDVSDYEGADIIHDLNVPIPPSLKGRFQAVVDAGSLEHVFNVAVSLQNCMDMVVIGGHLVIVTPTNNFCGHGLYQFSPELFFELLTPENGFELRGLLVKPTTARFFYAVTPPRDAKARVCIVNGAQTELFILARKLRACPGLVRSPVQADYVSAWAGKPALDAPTGRSARLAEWIKSVAVWHVLPSHIREEIRSVYQRRLRYRVSHGAFFTRIRL